MLDKNKVEKILDIIKNDNYYRTPVNIKINLKGNPKTWVCKTFNIDNFKLDITEEYLDYDWSNFFMKYAKKTFGLDDTWYKLHFYETTDLIVLLHEIGHMIHHNSLDDMLNCYLINTLSQSDYYKNMINGMNRRLAYRKSRCEFKADSIACNIFKKHGIEMLSIITNKTVKELNREKLVYNLNQNKLNKTSKYILERRG